MKKEGVEKASVFRAAPKAQATARAVPLPTREDGIAGLDKATVHAALQAGIDCKQLEELATMIGPAGRGKLKDAPGLDPNTRKMKLNILWESEEEPEVGDPVQPLTEAEKKDPMLAALTKLTTIVGWTTQCFCRTGAALILSVQAKDIQPSSKA